MYKYGKRLFDGGDGFVLKHGDTYYVYCTTETDLPAFTPEHPFFETVKDGRDGIEVHVSKDLIHWENKGYCLEKGEHVVGVHGFWAPEVSCYNGKFYMVYAVDERVAIAEANSPEGPFRKMTDDYLVDARAIDGHLFFDEDGTIYLYYCSLEGGNHIRVAKLAKDLKTVETFYNDRLIVAEEPWETVDCRIAEGPFVLKHNGVYYLTYSANHTRCPDYAVGYATSKSPLGPFEKSKNNPILHRFDDIVGTGHHSFMPTDDENTYICIYHCHGGDISGFKPRKICFAEAEFVNNGKEEPDDLVIHQ